MPCLGLILGCTGHVLRISEPSQVLSGYRGHPGQDITDVIHFTLISGLRLGSQIPPKACWISFVLLLFERFFNSFQICFWSASALLLCCVWFASGLLLRAFRAFWGGLAHSGTVSGACWDDFGVFRSILGQCREHGILVSFWEHARASCPVLVHLGQCSFSLAFRMGQDGAFGFHFGFPNGLKSYKKWVQKQVHFRVPCLLDFGAIPGSILGSKILRNIAKWLPKAAQESQDCEEVYF